MYVISFDSVAHAIQNIQWWLCPYVKYNVSSCYNINLEHIKIKNKY